MERLDGKVAIVTGAGGGIGRTMVIRLAEDTPRYLASDESSFMTGSAFVIDGGMTAR